MYADKRNSRINTGGKMISPEYFFNTLKNFNIDFFTGVPDSLLKSLCAYLTDNSPEENNIISTNEGSAIGLAVGYYLATKKIPVVYMQNSGVGNAVNPLLSLCDKEVYNIPLILLIGWRGEDNVPDEPQHLKQGKTTIPLLRVMGINHVVLSSHENEVVGQMENAILYMEETMEPFAFVVRKDTFGDYKLQKTTVCHFSMTRESAIKIVTASLNEKDVIVSTTGMISRELFEYREEIQQGHKKDFLTVGSMGHASQIALGIANQKKDRKVYCFDGDGAILMHLGSIAIIGSVKPVNYIHIVFNNGAHDSVGGQPTVGLNINLPQIALSCGYAYAFSIEDEKSLLQKLDEIKSIQGAVFLDIKVKKGARKDLGRPTTTPIQNKNAFIKFLNE
jgi:phosphonopyruvate decarboxylase